MKEKVTTFTDNAKPVYRITCEYWYRIKNDLTLSDVRSIIVSKMLETVETMMTNRYEGWPDYDPSSDEIFISDYLPEPITVLRRVKWPTVQQHWASPRIRPEQSQDWEVDWRRVISIGYRPKLNPVEIKDWLSSENIGATVFLSLDKYVFKFRSDYVLTGLVLLICNDTGLMYTRLRWS